MFVIFHGCLISESNIPKPHHKPVKNVIHAFNSIYRNVWCVVYDLRYEQSKNGVLVLLEN